jgi:hypothetical protein
MIMSNYRADYRTFCKGVRAKSQIQSPYLCLRQAGVLELLPELGKKESQDDTDYMLRNPRTIANKTKIIRNPVT